MSVFPDIEMVEVSRGRELPDRETALMWLRRMTWVMAGTEKDAALQKTIESVYDEEQDAYVLRNQRSIQGIVTWVTEQALG